MGFLKGQSEIRETTKTITSAQVLALFATPQPVVLAPGAGKALLLEEVLIYKPAGTAYAGVAAGEDLVLKYTNAAGLEISEQIEATGFLDQATAQIRRARPVYLAQSVLNPAANAAIVLHLLTGEVITGTSVLRVRTRYRIVGLTF